MLREAILGLSFGIKKSGHTKSNKALAGVVERVFDKKGLQVILQKELAECVDFPLSLVIKEHRIKGQYLDSDEVIAQAIIYLKANKINSVWLIAHPLLQRTKCRILLKKSGFKVRIPRTGKIPFDKDSLQWWTRGPLRTLVYAILQKFTGRKGR